eukprot:8989659-Heterocapsa_arctica.AAC.1
MAVLGMSLRIGNSHARAAPRPSHNATAAYSSGLPPRNIPCLTFRVPLPLHTTITTLTLAMFV